MEEDDTFDAGRGSFLTADGTVEMDALIMDGATLRAGGVGGSAACAICDQAIAAGAGEEPACVFCWAMGQSVSRKSMA